MDLIPKDLREAWAPAIGNFVIEFGHLEILISEVVRLSCLPGQFETLSALVFDKRASLARTALIHWHPSDKQTIESLFQTISTITGRRNTVAHNGLSLVEIESDGQYFYEVGMSKNYKANEVWLQIPDLERDTVSLQAIQERLFIWAHQVSKISQKSEQKDSSPL